MDPSTGNWQIIVATIRDLRILVSGIGVLSGLW